MKIKDGETIEVPGSGKEPWKVQRKGEVIFCNCPAWRNQSAPTNKRTCKHIRKIEGDEAEQTRIGGSLTVRAGKTKNKVTNVAPAILLAETWDESIDPAGWWMSEKLDGIRCLWDGQQGISRKGNPFDFPVWWKEDIPKILLDGELWAGRGKFQSKITTVVRTAGLDKEWKDVSYIIFDMPHKTAVFEDRMAMLMELKLPEHVTVHPHELCKGKEHLLKRLAEVEAAGGEGLMLRQPGSKYVGNRSSTLLKVKSFADAEAEITGYEKGKGNRAGMVGAFWVKGINNGFEGKKFKVGTGMSHDELKNPPKIGEIIVFRYIKTALSDDGKPKPASYVGLALDK